MNRRGFLAGAGTAGAGALLGGTAAARGSGYRFKVGMYLPELDQPFDQALATAREIGVDRVWFNAVKDETPIAEMSDADVDRMAERVARHGLRIFLIGASNPFKTLHLTDLDAKGLDGHPGFRKEYQDLVRSMAIAKRLGIPAVCTFTFAWPGEYGAGKPTWPMRWLTRGGVIADVDMEKLVAVFSRVAEQAERHGVDVALSMMPWNYTNTTGNFRRVVERVGSRRLKVMWGPADNVNCGESDVASAGFLNVRPHLYGLHLKDLHVIDGLRLKFEYRPLGTGDVDYRAVFRALRDHGCDVVLSLSTHFRPASGSRVEAMRINHANLRKLLDPLET